MYEEFYVSQPPVEDVALFGWHGGSVVEVGSEKTALIKYVYTDTRTDVYIKQCGDGAAKGTLFNPWGTMNSPNELNRNNRVGDPLYVWRKVNQASERLYIRFLETRNQNYLRNAERAL